MKVIRFLSILAFIGSILWFVSAPDYEPGIVIVTSLSTLVAVWFVDKQQKHQSKQSQVITEKATGIQAGGDVNIGVSASEARKIASDVAKATFYELDKDAQKTSEPSTKKIIENILSGLQNKSLSPSQANILNIEDRAVGITKTFTGCFAYTVPIEDADEEQLGKIENGSPQSFSGLALSADNPSVFTIPNLGYVMVKFNLLCKDTYEIRLMTYIEKPLDMPFSFRLIIESKIDVIQTIPAFTPGFFKEKSNSFILNEKDLEYISPTIVINKFTA